MDFSPFPVVAAAVAMIMDIRAAKVGAMDGSCSFWILGLTGCIWRSANCRNKPFRAVGSITPLFLSSVHFGMMGAETLSCFVHWEE